MIKANDSLNILFSAKKKTFGEYMVSIEKLIFHAVMWDLTSQPGIKPMAPAL